MNNIDQLQPQDKAEYLSKALQEELSILALQFDETVRKTGEKYGLSLLTEVTVGIDSKSGD
jgi:hypothetical protein